MLRRPGRGSKSWVGKASWLARVWFYREVVVRAFCYLLEVDRLPVEVESESMGARTGIISLFSLSKTCFDELMATTLPNDGFSTP